MNLATEKKRHEENGKLLDRIESIQNQIEIEKSNLSMYERNSPGLVEVCIVEIESLEAIEQGLIEHYLINIDSKRNNS